MKKKPGYHNVLGLSLIVAGIIVGLYVGLWVCFVGGIVGIIEAIRAPELVAMAVAINLVKIVLAGAAGFLSAFALILPGIAMLK
jgi:hypothetical protein